MDLSCWGIFRERTNSPGRETDDAEILRLTAKHLEAAGFQVSLKSAEEVGSLTEPRPRCVFLMCEGAEVLRAVHDYSMATSTSSPTRTPSSSTAEPSRTATSNKPLLPISARGLPGATSQ